MKTTITINPLDAASIEKAAREIQEYADRVQRRADELAKRLAEYGLQRIQIGYQAVEYYDENPVSVTVEERGQGQYAVVASGATLLILEFGSGVKYGAGHPQADEFGYGPGTYPGQTHVPDPGYWWYTGSDGKSHYSEGNAPSMVMYLTARELLLEVTRIAKEVFSS